jgi:hypothetical protein
MIKNPSEIAGIKNILKTKTIRNMSSGEAMVIKIIEINTIIEINATIGKIISVMIEEMGKIKIN